MTEETHTYPTTAEMRRLAAIHFELEKNMETVLRKTFFNRVSIIDNIRYVEELADAGYRFWEEVYNEYPHLLGEKVSFKNNKLVELE